MKRSPGAVLGRCAPVVLVVAASLLVTTTLSAQQSSDWFLQVSGGADFRSQATLGGTASTGVFGEARLGRMLGRHVALVGELSLANFEKEFIHHFVAIRGTGDGRFNPQPSAGEGSGLGLLGMSVGVQPHLGTGPFQLFASGTMGGYWLYRGDAGLPSIAPGIHGALGASLLLDPQVRLFTEFGATRLVQHDLAGTQGRHFNVGVSIN